MPDILDPLRHLGGTPLGEREPLDALRARTTRRRRRQRIVAAPVLVAGLVGIGALLATSLGNDDRPDPNVETVDDPEVTSTTTTTTTTTSTTDPATAPRPSIVAGPDGVFALSADGETTQLSTEPMWIAFGVGDVFVAQRAAPESSDTSGAIVVLDGSETRTLLAPQGGDEYLYLHDAGVVAGRAVAVVTRSRSPRLPDDYEVRMLRVDLETGNETDLGVVAGWEEGVHAAHLLPDGGVILSRDWILGGNLERLAANGTTVWATESVATDDILGRLVVHEGKAILVQPAPDAEGYPTTSVTVRRFDLTTGAELSTSTTTLGGSELEPRDDICGHRMESGPAGVICGGSDDGRIFTVDVDSGRATAIADVPHRGALTLWRDPPAS